MENVWRVEHNNLPHKILHLNEKEKNYTFYGIYPYTKLPSHKRIKQALKATSTIESASILLSRDKELYEEVIEWYLYNFYDELGMGCIKSTKIASELMVFFVNVGKSKYRVRLATQYIQDLVGVVPDGVIGMKTLKALNRYNEDKFDKLFDKFEEKFYRGLVKKVPRLSWALKGFINRAYLV